MCCGTEGEKNRENPSHSWLSLEQCSQTVEDLVVPQVEESRTVLARCGDIRAVVTHSEDFEDNNVSKEKSDGLPTVQWSPYRRTLRSCSRPFVIRMHIGFCVQFATPFLSNCRMRDAKAQRGCPSNRRCTLPLATHSNNSIDRSLPDRQFENFEKCKNP
jgi:hypothetical protein